MKHSIPSLFLLISLNGVLGATLLRADVECATQVASAFNNDILKELQDHLAHALNETYQKEFDAVEEKLNAILTSFAAQVNACNKDLSLLKLVSQATCYTKATTQLTKQMATLLVEVWRKDWPPSRGYLLFNLKLDHSILIGLIREVYPKHCAVEHSKAALQSSQMCNQLMIHPATMEFISC
ncbi:unnamed protein product, partial [Mesorhabditis belari]|uniref:Uncharacterized protein n=1 Tax=Mesorhabditis belari TaxID=2138241 RepID=A0AAF3J907_9BILA